VLLQEVAEVLLTKLLVSISLELELLDCILAAHFASFICSSTCDKKGSNSPTSYFPVLRNTNKKSQKLHKLHANNFILFLFYQIPIILSFTLSQFLFIFNKF